ncbi:30S ribosomal protein S20 [Turneriella parva]|uniref:Small ribosomal subunit protein bS20 n=1 Tax=Turneriella parva (strain ATCC BAA-1111 / DSM 21527 / NCTC 11395 / H) TaxID=869212 RepID=I4B6J8_TURPD|nr:30S ribosomal protein S20 [Turneriella parva]AFM12905.1 SSU ribosomal protein S20P [Turneriella parva DSM 21527]
MPNIASAKKRTRQNEKRRLKNQAEKSAIRTQEKKLRALVAEKKLEEAQKAQVQLSSLVDKAAKRNLVHKNAASRKKARTAQLVKKASAPAAT